MGLDYEYILFFERKDLWKAVDELVKISNHHEPPTIINFPNHKLTIPWVCSPFDKTDFNYDDPEFSFATSINFDVDEAILDYIEMIGDQYVFRGPPDPDQPFSYSIGYIYLTIHNDLTRWNPKNKSNDIVIFRFGTTGTKMSILFSESDSIRNTFCGLLEKVPGLYGIFNNEYDGELFWYKNRRVSKSIGDIFILPDKLDKILNDRR